MKFISYKIYMRAKFLHDTFYIYYSLSIEWYLLQNTLLCRWACISYLFLPNQPFQDSVAYKYYVLFLMHLWCGVESVDRSYRAAVSRGWAISCPGRRPPPVPRVGAQRAHGAPTSWPWCARWRRPASWKWPATLQRAGRPGAPWSPGKPSLPWLAELSRTGLGQGAASLH